MTPRDLPAGMHIRDAACLLVAQANEIGSACAAKFNDVTITANPGDDPPVVVEAYNTEMRARQAAWAASPEGIAHKKRMEDERIALQATADRLTASVDQLDLTDQKAVLRWLGELQPATNRIGVNWSGARIVEVFAAAGLTPNMDIGCNADDRDQMWRWIVGQALDGLVTGPAIHDLYQLFAAKWIARWEPR